MSGKTLGRIGYEALQAARWPDDPTAWTHPGVAVARPAWETAMQAVKAAVLDELADAVTPTAEDFDHAAEIMRLRDALTEVRTALLATGRHFPGGRGPIAIIDRANGQPLGDYLRERGRPRVADMIEQAEGEPQPAPELAAAMGETRKVADAANVVLDAFARGSDGWHARLSGVTLMRAYKAIGRPVPPQLSHLEGQ